MPNNYFDFKQFSIKQDKCAFKVGTDGVILGSYADVRGAETILDIGTGTGLIALMLAQRCKATVYAIEPDNLSFEQAKENFLSSKWSDRIFVFNSTLQNFFPDGVKFDLIVANPPFFSRSLKNPEKRAANARHNDSLPFGELLEGANRLLKDNGLIEIIIPTTESTELMRISEGVGLVCIKVLRIKPTPTSGFTREVIGLKKISGLSIERPVVETLVIEENGRHRYSPRYIGLTSEFYL